MQSTPRRRWTSRCRPRLMRTSPSRTRSSCARRGRVATGSTSSVRPRPSRALPSRLDRRGCPGVQHRGVRGVAHRGGGAEAGIRPGREDDPAGGVPGARRGLVLEGLLPRPGARVPHRHARARQPVSPAPHGHRGRTAAAAGPRSSRARRSSAPSRAALPPAPWGTCAMKSNRRPRSSSGGTATRPALASNPYRQAA